VKPEREIKIKIKIMIEVWRILEGRGRPVFAAED
jgi:hypothetical protein